MSLFELYLMLILPSVAVFLFVVGIFSFLIFTGAYFASYDFCRDDEYGVKFRSVCLKAIIPLSFFAMFLSTIIPDKHNMLILIGSHYVTNIDGAQDVPVNTIKALNKLLTEYVDKEETKTE